MPVPVWPYTRILIIPPDKKRGRSFRGTVWNNGSERNINTHHWQLQCADILHRCSCLDQRPNWCHTTYAPMLVQTTTKGANSITVQSITWGKVDLRHIFIPGYMHHKYTRFCTSYADAATELDCHIFYCIHTDWLGDLVIIWFALEIVSGFIFQRWTCPKHNDVACLFPAHGCIYYDSNQDCPWHH